VRLLKYNIYLKHIQKQYVLPHFGSTCTVSHLCEAGSEMWWRFQALDSASSD